MKKIKPVHNWRKLHKSFTVIMSGIGMLVGLLEVILPHLGLLQSTIDPVTYGYIMFTITVLIAVGRYIQQDNIDKKEDGDV